MLSRATPDPSPLSAARDDKPSLSFRGRRPRNLNSASRQIPRFARDDGGRDAAQDDRANLERYVPVLLGGEGRALAFEQPDRGDQFPARLGGLDDLVDVAAARGDVGVCEVLDVLGDLVRPALRRGGVEL